MHKQACAFIFAAAFLLFSGTPFPASGAPAKVPDIEEVTSNLDRAFTQKDILNQISILQSMTAKSGILPYTKENTQLTRAYYLMGEAEKDKGKKLSYLNKALETSKYVFQYDPGNVHALYWRSMALLQKADVTGGLSALKMVKEALRGLETVSAKEPSYDSAGAYRSRGKVLIEAPGWAFIGDRKKGLELLKKAKEIAPGPLVNRLYLAQAYAKNGMKGQAAAELEYIRKAPPGPNTAEDREIREEAEKLYKNF